MQKLALVVLVSLLIALPVAAQSWCYKCYDPPGELNEYCGTTTYNGVAECWPHYSDGTGCEMSGPCQGTSGEQCGARHCIPDKWACALPLPEKANWVVASVKIESNAVEVTPQRRTRS